MLVHKAFYRNEVKKRVLAFFVNPAHGPQQTGLHFIRMKAKIITPIPPKNGYLVFSFSFSFSLSEGSPSGMAAPIILPVPFTTPLVTPMAVLAAASAMATTVQAFRLQHTHNKRPSPATGIGLKFMQFPLLERARGPIPFAHCFHLSTQRAYGPWRGGAKR